MRFYEINSGTLRVDGHPIDTVTRDSLRANLGMVLQETWLKAGTIAENIAYGKPDATREGDHSRSQEGARPQLYLPPAERIRHTGCRGRRQYQSGAAAAALHCAGHAAASADSDFG